MAAKKAGWKPGQSGNPKGRPKDPERDKLRQMARTHTEAALNTVVDIMNDTTAKPGIRLKAAQEVLDRAWGKAAPLPPEVEEEAKTVTTMIQLDPSASTTG